MATIASWGGHTFVVNANDIRGFTGLTVKASCNTEDKTMDNETYVARKNSGAYSITITAVLDSRMSSFPNGVQEAAMSFCDDVYDSKEDYFYMGNGKLLPQKLMGVKATVQNVEIGHDGGWVRCEINLEFKQSTKSDGTLTPEGGSGNGNGKKTTRKGATRVTQAYWYNYYIKKGYSKEWAMKLAKAVVSAGAKVPKTTKKTDGKDKIPPYFDASGRMNSKDTAQ